MQDEARKRLKAKLRAKRQERRGGSEWSREDAGGGLATRMQEAVLKAAGDDAQALQVASALLSDPGKAGELLKAVTSCVPTKGEEEVGEEEAPPPPSAFFRVDQK